MKKTNNKDLVKKATEQRVELNANNNDDYYFDLVIEIKRAGSNELITAITQRNLTKYSLQFLINNLETIRKNTDFEKAMQEHMLDSQNQEWIDETQNQMDEWHKKHMAKRE